MSMIRVFLAPFLTKFIILFVFFSSLTGCYSKKPKWNPPSKGQRYIDQTRRYFPKPIEGLAFGRFSRIDQDPLSDLILIPKQPRSEFQILTYTLKGGRKYQANFKNGLKRDFKMDIKLIVAGDLNQDRSRDLVLLGRSQGQSTIHFLLNNKKGYFYFPPDPLPPIKNGVERIEIVDIDHDGDQDLLLFGKALRESNGRSASNNAQLLINQGEGKFTDFTRLLLPPVIRGMVAVSIADYDGDGVLDIFWIHGSGRNALWINNGIGKFFDRSNRSLPRLPAQYAFADWADFDMDGDNDILLVATHIPKKYRAHENEFCFFLENDGQGIFNKRSLELLPAFPSHRVYLLDSDANGVPDILILSRRGVHFLVGQGPWKFSDETVKRLPFSAPFDEMAFGDINGDGNLDIFGILSKSKTGRLWVDRID